MLTQNVLATVFAIFIIYIFLSTQKSYEHLDMPGSSTTKSDTSAECDSTSKCDLLEQRISINSSRISKLETTTNDIEKTLETLKSEVNRNSLQLKRINALIREIEEETRELK